MIDEASIQRAAELAVEHTIKLLLGVDIKDQDQVNEFRADLIHTRKWRKMAERTSGAAVLALVAMVATSVAALLWDSLVRIFGRH